MADQASGRFPKCRGRGRRASPARLIPSVVEGTPTIGAILLAVVALILTGCQERRGPTPILSAETVEQASTNKIRIMQALSADAGLAPLIPSPGWYFVAEAGFNFVDDQCRAYFDELFFLDRAREQTKSGLSAAGQTAAAVMGATGAPATSLAIVAQAFGFGISATDLVAGSYLYQLPPATTLGFVQRLQSAFRDEAARQQARVNSPTAAYYLVQRYLDLCLPPRIEAEITKQISSARAVPVPRGGGAFFTLETVTPPVVGSGLQGAADVSRPAPGSSTRVFPRPQPMYGPPRSGPNPPNRDDTATFLAFDARTYNPGRLAAVLRRLCIRENDPPGRAMPPGTLVKVYQQSVGEAVTGLLTIKQFTRLDDAGIPECRPPGAVNFVEATRLGGDVSSAAALKILNLGLPAAEQIDVGSAPDLSTVRSKILLLRSLLASQLVLRDEALSDQVTADLLGAIIVPRQ